MKKETFHKKTNFTKDKSIQKYTSQSIGFTYMVVCEQVLVIFYVLIRNSVMTDQSYNTCFLVVLKIIRSFYCFEQILGYFLKTFINYMFSDAVSFSISSRS